MSGTISSPSSIMSTQAVDNTTGLLTPATIRNIVESLAGSPTSTQTGSYTVAATDRGTVLNLNSASAVNVTVNSGVLSSGQQFGIRQLGAGQVTVVGGSGMTLQSSTGTYATRAQYSLIMITAHTTATTLFVDGDLA